MRLVSSAFFGCAIVFVNSLASAQDGAQWEKTIKVESDFRFRLEEKSVGNAFARKTLTEGVERNQNILGTKLAVSWENLRAVAQADLVLYGYSQQINGIEGLSKVEQLQPYRIDINELYVQVKDLLVDGFDVRIGQQIVQWGVADQFNPTNNLNPDDLIDPLLFGKQQGNFMVRGDFWVTDDFSLQGVMVPLFKAARLPESSQLAIYSLDRLPFNEAPLRYRISTERTAALALARIPTVVDKVTIEQPEPSFENIQAGFKLGGTLAEQDWSLSYYNGRTDFPVAKQNHTRQVDTALCSPKGNCSAGALLTDVTLHYPKMHVYGLNVAGEFNPFKGIDPNINGIGYRLEGALVVPQEVKMKLTNDEITLIGQTIPAGEYDYDGDGNPGGPQPQVVDNQPYLKWTLGLDYTFGSSVYVNTMWIHGFADEYGPGDWMFDGKAVRFSESLGDNGAIIGCALAQDGSKCGREILRPKQGDFLVLGVDYKFLNDQALARLFAIIEMSGYVESTVDAAGNRIETDLPWYTPEGFSAVLYPEFNYNFGNGLELGAGALFNLGKTYTKFGAAEAGGSLTYARARYTL